MLLSLSLLQNGIHISKDAVSISGGGPLSNSQFRQAVPGTLPYAHQQYAFASTQVSISAEGNLKCEMLQFFSFIKLIVLIIYSVVVGLLNRMNIFRKLILWWILLCASCMLIFKLFKHLQCVLTRHTFNFKSCSKWFSPHGCNGSPD